MKKTLLGLAIISFIGLSTNGAFAGYYYQAPNAGNMSFYPMMQRQMEQQETLDFVNHPEEYKEKRAKKDAQLDYEEGKVNPNVNPYYKPTSFNLKQKEDLPLQKPMEFSKDENGQIRIQGIK
jgi:hypothetical protein